MPPKIKHTPPARSRERIIVFGMAGVGKTKSAMQIMDQCVGEFWIIETDNTYDEFLEAYPNVQTCEEWEGQKKVEDYTVEGGKAHLFRVRNWVDYCWAIEQCFTRASRDDWIFIDNVTNLWDEVQTWYVTEAYGKTPGEFGVQIRKKQIEKGKTDNTVAQELFTDWGAINPTYFENVKKYISSPPCHLMMMAEQDTIASGDGKQKVDKEVRATFGPYGVKPKGQKSLAHTCRTVLLLTKDQRFGEETYMLTSVKDREREKLDAEEWGDFVGDYLVKVGGWKKMVVKEEK